MDNRLTQMLVILAMYILAMLLLIIGFATQNWLTYGEYHFGLYKVCSQGTCVEYLDALPSKQKAAFALLCLAFIAGVVAGFTFVIVPVSGGLQFLAGLLQIIGAGIFVSDSEGGSVSWSFGLAIVAGVILLISGAVYAFIARKHGYTLKPQIPCRGENA